MTKAEIDSIIQTNKNRLTSLNKSLNDKKSQIRELKALKSAIDSYKEDFIEREAKRQKKLGCNAFKNCTLKSVSTYVSEMKKVIKGKDYSNSISKLEDAQGKVNKKITSVEKEIKDIKNDIAYREERIRYWKKELNNAT